MLSKNNQIKSLDDIFHIHWLLYRTHAFTNWNKRLSRIIEAALLKSFWFEWILNTNIWYHYHKNLYKRALLRDVISEQNFEKVSDLWKASMLLSAIYIIERELSLIKKKYCEKNELEIFSVLPFWISLTTKELNEKYNKLNKYNKTLPERTFYWYLESEKKRVWDLIIEEKVGRNVFYSLNIQDPKYTNLSEQLVMLINNYKKYNMEYYDIPFLKNY
jgi:hypothetical protein